MLVKRKKLFVVTTLIFIAALALVIFVNYFTGNSNHEFDGTLVRTVTTIYHSYS